MTIQSFIFALFSTLGFCIIFHVPLKHMPVAALIGGVGWIAYQACLAENMSAVISCFVGACLVGLLSDISSRVFKEAATIFIIPGILPLVPGAGMYSTMQAMVSNNLSLAAATGSKTLLMAGAIALGLLVIGAIIRIIVSILRRASYIANKL